MNTKLTVSAEPTTEHERLNIWRLNNGLTGQDLADATDYTQPAISYFLTGARPMTDAFYWRFLKAYGRYTFNALFPDKAIK